MVVYTSFDPTAMTLICGQIHVDLRATCHSVTCCFALDPMFFVLHVAFFLGWLLIVEDCALKVAHHACRCLSSLCRACGAWRRSGEETWRSVAVQSLKAARSVDHSLVAAASAPSMEGILVRSMAVCELLGKAASASATATTVPTRRLLPRRSAGSVPKPKLLLVSEQ